MVERRNGQPINHPHPDPVERAEQINQIWEYKRAGRSYKWIGETMGMSSSTAHKLFKEGLMMQAPPAAEEERILAVQQMEVLFEIGMDQIKLILDPLDKIKALVHLDKLVKSRRELLGLDAAIKFQGMIHEVTQQDLEIQGMIDMFKSQEAERAAAQRSKARE